MIAVVPSGPGVFGSAPFASMRVAAAAIAALGGVEQGQFGGVDGRLKPDMTSSAMTTSTATANSSRR